MDVINGITRDDILSSTAYTFPLPNLIYDKEDEQIISKIVVMLDKTQGKIYSSKIGNVIFQWKVRNYQPYVYLICGILWPQHITIYLEDRVEYTVFTRDNTGNRVYEYSIEKSREIALSWLEKVYHNCITISSVTVDVVIKRPNMENISLLNERLLKIWHIVWYDFGGELPNRDVIWIKYDEGLKLSFIRNNESKDIIYYERIAIWTNSSSYVIKTHSLPTSPCLDECINTLDRFIEEIESHKGVKSAIFN